jgi:hypothetical protein
MGQTERTSFLTQGADCEEGRGYGQFTQEIEQSHRSGSGLVGTGTGEIIDREGQKQPVSGTSENDLHGLSSAMHTRTT